MRNAKQNTLADFDAGLQALRDRDGRRAVEAFDRCLTACPADTVAATLRDMASALAQGGSLDAGKGTFTLA